MQLLREFLSLSTLLRSIDEYGFSLNNHVLLNQDATAFYQPFPTQPHLYKDEEERKPTVFKTIPSSFWCVFQPRVGSISVALAVGLLFTSGL